jgi:DNA polymerase-3 subunit delta
VAAARGKAPDSLAVRKAVDAGRIPRVWLWTGPEGYLKDQLMQRVVERVLGDAASPLSVDRFRAGADPMDRVLESCRTFPMLAPHRIVFLQEVEDSGKKERDSLLAYVENPSPETTLIITGSRSPGDSLYKRLEKAGAESAVFWIPFPEQTRQWIQIQFKDRGKQCDAETARALLERCGGGSDRQVGLCEVAPEIEKVAIAAGDQTAVTLDDLEVIGRKPHDALLYEVMDRVTAGDASGALEALDGALLFRENSEIRIVATLTHRLLNLLRVRELVDTGCSAAEAGRRAGIWQREMTAVEAGVRVRSSVACRRALKVLADADRTLKSTGKDPRLVLETTIVTICNHGG